MLPNATPDKPVANPKPQTAKLWQLVDGEQEVESWGRPEIVKFRVGFGSCASNLPILLHGVTSGQDPVQIRFRTRRFLRLRPLLRDIDYRNIIGVPVHDIQNVS